MGVYVTERRRLQRATIQEAKLFANYIAKHLKLLSYNKAALSFSAIYEIILLFRKKYVSPLRAHTVIADEEVRQAYLWVDEFICDRLNQFFSQVGGKAHPQLREFQETIKSELEYRNLYYERYTNIQEEICKERFYYRQSTLKKFVSDILFLKARPIKRDSLYRNIIATGGAGFAALWAGLTNLNTPIASGAQNVGLSFFPMLFLGVFLYIFKDRIKELTKEYFNQKIKTKLPDIETKLEYGFSQQKGEYQEVEISHTKEYLRYLKDEHAPEEIRYIRDLIREQTLSIPLNENIIHYSKKIWVQHDMAYRLKRDGLSLKDIFRFNIREFLSRFDNPLKTVALYDSNENDVALINAPRSYYFDLILRISYKTPGESSRHTKIEAIRLVLNKNGLVRLDPLLPKNKFHFEESSL